ncbi:MAG TPA: hypothetical protein VG294_00975 [Solirubrobacteraceae bacterium]|jgi:hypothetical protein|nr:hypothetical protein [Solirubrobacteraceae bacterium]
MTKTMQPRIAVVLAIAGGALLAAGCGGTAKPPGNSATGAPGNGAAAAYRFSKCMRDHGVTSFPDPVVHSSAGHQSVGIAVTPRLTGSPAFGSAQKACQAIMPGSGPGGDGSSPQQIAAHVKGMVSFASCMRSHHVPTFPDPSTQGQLTPAMLSAAGVNLHAPAVRAAAIACVPASQGQLTVAQVTQALGKP